MTDAPPPEPSPGAPPPASLRAMMGAQPDAPPRSRPRRFVHRLLRELVAVFVLILDLGRRFGTVLLRTEYMVKGACHVRGACCHHVLLEWTPILDRYPFLGRLVLWKLTRFYSFYDRGYTWEVEDGLMARVLGCHALLPDGRCGEHRIRPAFCRSYPELPLLGKGAVLKGCGFRFERRDGRPDTIRAEAGPGELVQLGRRRPPRRLEP